MGRNKLAPAPEVILVPPDEKWVEFISDRKTYRIKLVSFDVGTRDLAQQRAEDIYCQLAEYAVLEPFCNTFSSTDTHSRIIFGGSTGRTRPTHGRGQPETYTYGIKVIRRLRKEVPKAFQSVKEVWTEVWSVDYYALDRFGLNCRWVVTAKEGSR